MNHQTQTFTVGHAHVYPPIYPQPLPTLHGIRLTRRTDKGQSIRTIACNQQEYTWIVQQLAKRRAKQATGRKRSRRGKALPRNQDQ